ncbi:MULTISPECIES: hypothetical protein [unclassified Streptomyces]|uniref:hypothetical protein n=1 Tax=unclassified Streptomyces TaxID=2593676 RepID=UPI003D8DA5AB
MTERTCDAHVPAGLAQNLTGDAAEPCFLVPGHDQWTDHTNAHVTWPRRAGRAALATEAVEVVAA